jgi:S-phase kinase-associated protein 1
MALAEGNYSQYIAVSYNLVNRVCSYLQHHAGEQPPAIPYPLRSCRMADVVSKWNATFIDDVWLRSKTDLFDLTIVARYLEIASLLELACAKIASLVKGKPLSQITSILKNNDEDDDGSYSRIRFASSEQ